MKMDGAQCATTESECLGLKFLTNPLYSPIKPHFILSPILIIDLSQSKADEACLEANSMCASDPYKQKCVMNYYKYYVDGACNARIGKIYLFKKLI